MFPFKFGKSKDHSSHKTPKNAKEDHLNNSEYAALHDVHASGLQCARISASPYRGVHGERHPLRKEPVYLLAPYGFLISRIAYFTFYLVVLAIRMDRNVSSVTLKHEVIGTEVFLLTFSGYSKYILPTPNTSSSGDTVRLHPLILISIKAKLLIYYTLNLAKQNVALECLRHLKKS